MAKYQSPFSIDYRKPVTIMSNDPRVASNKIGQYEGRVGSEIIISPTIGNPLNIKPIDFQGLIAQQTIQYNLPSGTTMNTDFQGNVYHRYSMYSYIKQPGSQYVEGNRDVLMKLDKNGNPLWQKRMYFSDDGTHAYIGLSSQITDKNGFLYLLFGIQNYPSMEAVTVLAKLDTLGNTIWTRTIQHNTQNYENAANKIFIDKNLNIYIMGTVMIKYDNSGNKLWEKRITGNNFSVDSNGNIYTSSLKFLSSSGGIVRYGLVLVKYDTDGNYLWNKLVDNAIPNGYTIGSNFVYGEALVKNDSSNYIYTLATTDVISGYWSGGRGTQLIKYDSSGNIVWQKKISDMGQNNAQALYIDSAENIYTVSRGNSVSTPGFYSIQIAKYSNSGSLIFQKRIRSSYVDAWDLRFDNLGSVSIDKDGVISFMAQQRISVNYSPYYAFRGIILKVSLSQMTSANYTISDGKFVVENSYLNDISTQLSTSSTSITSPVSVSANSTITPLQFYIYDSINTYEWITKQVKKIN